MEERHSRPTEQAPKVPNCLGERPEGMDKDTYKFLRRIQQKFLKEYLKDPAKFRELMNELNKNANK